MNLECDFLWEKENFRHSDSVTVCVRVKHVAMDPEYYDEEKKGRYGTTGYIYNIHQPFNPADGRTYGRWLGEIRKYAKQE